MPVTYFINLMRAIILRGANSRVLDIAGSARCDGRGAFFTLHGAVPEQTRMTKSILGVWHHDYPGIMITDTAPFRYPHYHSATDSAR